MKIVIEAQRIFRTNKHGMGFVAPGIIRELQKIDHKSEYYILVSLGEDHCLQSSPDAHIIELRCPTYPLQKQVILPHAMARMRPNLLHCISNTAPLYCSVALVLTLHNIIFLERCQSFSKS